MKKILLIILFLCSPIFASDPTLDPNNIGWWKFDAGVVWVNEVVGGPLFTPTASDPNDAVNKIEGTGSAQDTNANGLYMSNASAPASCMLKSTGTSTQFSMTFWAKTDTTEFPINYVFKKGGSGAGGRCFALYYGNGGQTLSFFQSHDATNREYFDSGQAQTAGQWYHYGIVYDKTAKTIWLRMYGATEDSVLVAWKTTTFTNTIAITTGNFGIMEEGISGYYMKGNVDEMQWYDDLLTADEIDAIRGGTYMSSGINLLPQGFQF